MSETKRVAHQWESVTCGDVYCWQCKRCGEVRPYPSMLPISPCPAVEPDKLAAQVGELREDLADASEEVKETTSTTDALRKELAEAKELHREMIAAQFAMSAPRFDEWFERVDRLLANAPEEPTSESQPL